MTAARDRPQVVIGLLCTGDGIPIAHHVFAGNTADVTTLPGVLDDLPARFGVGRICVVADRGLISADNVDIVAGQGFDHVLATRLHRDPTCAEALTAAATDDAVWVPVPAATSAACDVTSATDAAPSSSPAPNATHRDTMRTAELVARTEAKLLALEDRVRAGRLVDAGKIGRAAQRILGPSGVGRLFDVEIAEGRFLYHYNEAAFAYEELLAGRYVLITSLTADQGHPPPRSSPPTANCYPSSTASGSSRTSCTSARAALDRTTASAATSPSASTPPSSKPSSPHALAAADVRDPDLARPTPHRRPRPARTARIRDVTLTAGDHTINVVTRRNPLQASILAALDVDTSRLGPRPHQLTSRRTTPPM